MASVKLSAEKRVERAHAQLMRHKDFCLFSGVFMVGKVSVSETVPTAMTNGRDVVYGRAFVDMLDDKQLAFVVVHEAMHKAYRHLTTWKGIAKENPQLANAAMDFVINLQIVDSDPTSQVVAMPRDADGKIIGLLDEKYRDMDTKQVYNILKEECRGSGDGGDDGDGNGRGQNDGGSGSPTSGGQGNNKGNFDEHDWEGATDLSKEEEDELTQEIDNALREGAILAGKMKGNVPRGIDELLHPRVDWKEALRMFTKSNVRGGDKSTWRRPNRRFLGVDIIMPSSISEKAGTFVIGIDLSGSIGAMAAQFMGEVQSICNDVAPEAVELLYWDSHVTNHETYRDAEVANLISSTKPKGGGGTQPECVPIYLEAKHIAPQCIIMLTDGEFYGDGWGEWSRTSAPVLWCVVGNKDFVPKHGQSVYVG
jgi:predicted metal-dependent peptidase